MQLSPLNVTYARGVKKCQDALAARRQEQCQDEFNLTLDTTDTDFTTFSKNFFVTHIGIPQIQKSSLDTPLTLQHKEDCQEVSRVSRHIKSKQFFLLLPGRLGGL